MVGENTIIFRKHCCDLYYEMAQDNSQILPDLLVQVMAWVLGEYGHFCSNASDEDIIQVLSDLMESQFECKL